MTGFLLDGDGVVDGSTVADSWLSVTDLQPYTNYSFWIRGCNTQGCVESLPLNVTTTPAGRNANTQTLYIKGEQHLTTPYILDLCTQTFDQNHT